MKNIDFDRLDIEAIPRRAVSHFAVSDPARLTLRDVELLKDLVDQGMVEK